MIQILRNKGFFFLLLIPALFAILALLYHDFNFKSGVAGSCILIMWVHYFMNLNRRMDVLMISGAFAFSIAGDWCLSNRIGDADMFISGILLFFIAHTGYLSFSLLNGKISWSLTVILLVTYLTFFIFGLYPASKSNILSLASLAYLLISCLSLGAAAGIKGPPFVRWFYFSGIFLILFSDTIIALKEFLNVVSLNYLILPTYYLAQIFITTAILRKGWNTNQQSQKLIKFYISFFSGVFLFLLNVP